MRTLFILFSAICMMSLSVVCYKSRYKTSYCNGCKNCA